MAVAPEQFLWNKHHLPQANQDLSHLTLPLQIEGLGEPSRGRIRGKFSVSGTGMSHITSHIHELLLLPKETPALASVFQVRVLLRTEHPHWLFLSSYSEGKMD